MNIETEYEVYLVLLKPCEWSRELDLFLILHFFPDKQSITSSDRFRFSEGLMEISQLKPSDKGDYVCEASNALGTSTKTIKVYLDGKLIFSNCFKLLRSPKLTSSFLLNFSNKPSFLFLQR